MRLRSVAWVVGMIWLLGAFVAAAPRAVSPVSAKAVISRKPLVRGEAARVVVEVQVAAPWHIQSATPHDKYLIPTSLAVTTPAGVKAGAVRYPVAQEIATPGGISSEATIAVYEGTVYIEVPLRVAADAPVGPASIGLVLMSQACTTTCLPPKKVRVEVPVEIAAGGTAGAALSAEEAAVLKGADAQKYATPAPAAPAPATTAPAATAPAAPAPDGAAGVKLLSAEEQVAVIQSRAYKALNAGAEQYSIWAIVLFALAAGAILNVMPCVLPVIPLKVLSLVQQAHGDRRLAVVHALVFSAGIISLFVGLAVVLKGSHLFYGQQFQSPAFLIAMALVVVAFALSMLGVWTINPPRAVYSVETGGHGYMGSFANGVLATLLATPCSAPYLGPVLAWAFAQPTWVTSLALALVGVGMSLPYVILAAYPVGLNKLPRAGRWSELLKQGLGIVMLGVALYLVTLVPNVTMWPWVLFGGVVVSLVCWGWGQIPTVSMEAGRVWGIRAAVVVIGVGLGLGVYGFSQRAVLAETPALQAGGEWQPFNVALLDAALKERRPVVVDWTASWCINCRSLDALVLSTEEVRKAFKDSNAVLLRADLSSDNPPATVLNEKLGGEAIPVLAIFAPGRPLEPVVLRDAYTRDRVVREVGAAK